MPEYFDLENVEIHFSPAKFNIDVYIDHAMGYAGYTSSVGVETMDTPAKWAAYEFVFHAGSEHTINGKRFDMELQVYHVPYEENEIESTEATDERRNLGKSKESNS